MPKARPSDACPNLSPAVILTDGPAEAMVGFTFLAGIKVNYANFAAFPITFGIGVDYAVNIMARFRQERARRPRDALPVDSEVAPVAAVERSVLSTGGAVALCSLTTIIGYSSLLLAKNQALFLFGAVA